MHDDNPTEATELSRRDADDAATRRGHGNGARAQ